MTDGQIADKVERRWCKFSKKGVERGLPPSWFGYRWVKKETVPAYFQRKRHVLDRGLFETIHPEIRVNNPLPQNWAVREALPKDSGWWGYSFHDVPERLSNETFLATVPDCRVVPYIDPRKNQFWVGILNSDDRAFDIREFHFRAAHARALRSSASPVRLKSATWVAERVYHNYSHWLTAHLPKFLLLKSLNRLDDVLLPPNRPGFIDSSLKMVGLEPEMFSTFDPLRPLSVRALTLLGTDRFRPELLCMVRDAMPKQTAATPYRRVFISRANASRRRLVNEPTIWPILQRAGFERVFMEAIGFEQQVHLMQETAVLCGVHGAGLTNMMFCAPGTHVVEMADLSFPNPNFYAVASAMGHPYWLLSAETVGEGHPLERDLRIDPAAVHELLPRWIASAPPFTRG